MSENLKKMPLFFLLAMVFGYPGFKLIDYEQYFFGGVVLFWSGYLLGLIEKHLWK